MYTTYADVRCCLTSTYPNNSVIDLLTLTFLTECPLKVFNFCASFLVVLSFALNNFHTMTNDEADTTLDREIASFLYWPI